MCENGPKSGGSGNYLNKCRAVPTLIFYYPILSYLLLSIYDICILYLYDLSIYVFYFLYV